MTVPCFDAAIPVLRIYDTTLAYEFYLDFMGFSLDWEHRFKPDAPVYAQVSRGGLKLHLSEHYGDGTPGSAVYIKTQNAPEFFRELLAKDFKFARPSPCSNEATITDPFGNSLRFDGADRSS